MEREEALSVLLCFVVSASKQRSEKWESPSKEAWKTCYSLEAANGQLQYSIDQWVHGQPCRSDTSVVLSVYFMTSMTSS